MGQVVGLFGARAPEVPTQFPLPAILSRTCSVSRSGMKFVPEKDPNHREQMMNRESRNTSLLSFSIRDTTKRVHPCKVAFWVQGSHPDGTADSPFGKI